MRTVIPAWADTSEQDRQFLSALRSAGWTISSTDVLIGRAHQVCDEGFGHGVSWREMHTTLVGWGYSARDASTLIEKASGAYCPQYATAATAPPGSLQPTYADGDAFAKEVYDHGLLQKVPKRDVVQLLASICSNARSSVGRNTTVAVLYAADYGLSRVGAAWLVDTALAKCS